MTRIHTLIVGVGSDHGDDRLGWRVVELLGEHSLPSVSVQAVRVPLQLLDLNTLYDRWIVVDAVASTHEPGTIYQWGWPNIPAVSFPLRDSHGFPLPEVLRLADELDRLPARVQIWGVAVNKKDSLPQHTGLALTKSVEFAASQVTQRISEQVTRQWELVGRSS